MQTSTFRAARAIAVAAFLSTAPATLAGLGDFFLLNNSSAGLYRGQVGVDNGEGLLGPLPIGSSARSTPHRSRASPPTASS